MVRAAYSSARPGLALPFPCCQYLAAHDAARDAGFDAAAQSASTALPPFAVAPPPSPVHSRHPVAVASAAHLDTTAALAVAALAALAPCRSCRSRPHTFLPGSSELRDQIRVRVIARVLGRHHPSPSGPSVAPPPPCFTPQPYPSFSDEEGHPPQDQRHPACQDASRVVRAELRWSRDAPC